MKQGKKKAISLIYWQKGEERNRTIAISFETKKPRAEAEKETRNRKIGGIRNMFP